MMRVTLEMCCVCPALAILLTLATIPKPNTTISTCHTSKTHRQKESGSRCRLKGHMHYELLRIYIYIYICIQYELLRIRVLVCVCARTCACVCERAWIIVRVFFLTALVLNGHNLDNSIVALILEHNDIVVLEIKTGWVEHGRVVGGGHFAAWE